MRDFEELFDDSTEGSPFSNSTMGDMWMGQWCENCQEDVAFTQGDTENGCPLLALAMIGRTPKEWVKVPGSQDYVCSEFKEATHG